MKFPVATLLKDKGSGKPISAEIRPTEEFDLLAWTAWRHREGDQDKGWDWGVIFQECQRSGGQYECYSLLVADDLHGLMALDLGGRKRGKVRDLAVDYVAANPANRLPGAGVKNVGIALIGVALIRSIECGMAGRIWLESLSGAEGFYESLGMAKMTRKSTEGNAIFVLGNQAAKTLLGKIKAQGVIKP